MTKIYTVLASTSKAMIGLKAGTDTVTASSLQSQKQDLCLVVYTCAVSQHSKVSRELPEYSLAPEAFAELSRRARSATSHQRVGHRARVMY